VSATIGGTEEEEEEEEETIPHRPKSVAMELIPCRPFSRRGWNPVKLAYKLAVTASAFKQLGQYVNSPGHRAYWYAELAVFFPSCSGN